MAGEGAHCINGGLSFCTSVLTRWLRACVWVQKLPLWQAIQ